MSRIVVIGGTSGIGEALRRKSGEAGHEVVVVSRSEASLSSGESFVKWDATGEEDLELEGAVDGLVYCPGSIVLKPIARLKVDDFRKDFELNCLGAVCAIQSLLPNLKQSGSASVVLFSTVAVQMGMPFHASVAAAKGAVEGLGRSLAAELAPAVRVNMVAPSLTDTPLAGGLLGNEARREAAADRHPLKDVGQPDDVADLVLSLLSDSTRFMTGQVIRPDGGLSSVRLF